MKWCAKFKLTKIAKNRLFCITQPRKELLVFKQLKKFNLGVEKMIIWSATHSSVSECQK